MSLSEITQRIAKAEVAAHRPAGAVTLVAVSKVQPIARVEAVLEQGQRLFGENKVQEAASKWPDLRSRYEGVRVHLIGPLQSNKARQAMQLFDVIETLDRPKLATAIARIAKEEGKCPDLMIQVNTGAEPQKAGIAPNEADTFIKECRALGLPIIGLMCIPPADEEPSLHFALLAKIAARNELEQLSMGMSADFESAIAQGATYVRVGSAIFGARDLGAKTSSR
ncbi:MAG: pyridoxal phosphate enzyme (YggS family) [Halocynthiibacter sp.]|jgi:pyridoxal phosphate enzyme (YggS family)